MATTATSVERGEHGEDGTDDRAERKPPLQCARLFDYFSGNEISAKTNRYERASSGSPDPERALINSRRVGFRQHTEAELLDRASAAVALREKRRARGDDDWHEDDEPEPFKDERVSHAQRLRGTGELLAKLPSVHVDVLRRRYGPQDYEPYLKLRESVTVPSKTDRNRAAAMETIHWNERRRKLAGRTGPLAQVLPLTCVARDAYAEWRITQSRPVTLIQFIEDVLTSKALERVLGAAKIEAFNAWVRPAWTAWEPLGVRRRPRNDMHDEPVDLR